MDEDIHITGSYETQKGSTLMVVFERCDPDKDTCKSETEIDEWLNHRWIIVFENVREF